MPQDGLELSATGQGAGKGPELCLGYSHPVGLLNNPRPCDVDGSK